MTGISATVSPGSTVFSGDPATAAGVGSPLREGVALSPTLADEPALKLSGNRTSTLRYQHYSGLAPAASGLFQSGFSRHETTRLKVSGSALGTVKVEGEIFQSDVDFDNKYMLHLATHRYDLFLGEFPASFEDSEFTLFNRNVQGARLKAVFQELDSVSPQVDVMGLASTPRGSKHYEKFYGRDTQGPYQLQAFPVVLESERVLVDKVPQSRNSDYEINALTGQIVFKKRIIEARSLVEVTYEARDTVYPRALYGGQVRYRFADYDTLGLMGLDERDRKQEDVYAASGVPATAHTILGTTYRHDGEFLRLGGEYAHSFHDPDRFSPGLANGNAYKGSMEVERYGARFGGDFRRMEPRYRSLGNVALGTDYLGWGGYGSVALGRVWSAGGEFRRQDTVLNGARDLTDTVDAKTEVTPPGWPKAGYRYFQADEGYTGYFDRLERRHTATVSDDLKHLHLTSGYERQDILFRDGSQPDRRWDAGLAGIAVRGINWLDLSVNGELREGRESSTTFAGSSRFQTYAGTVNVGLTPNDRYYLGGSNNFQKTTDRPAANTLRTDAKAKPVDQLSLEGNYSQETLQMFHVAGLRPARTDSFGGLIQASPVADFSLLYQSSVRETSLNGVSRPVNATRSDGYLARWAAGSVASLEGGLTVEDYRLRDTYYPDLRMQTSEDASTWNAGMKVAPLPAVSAEFGYQDKLDTKAQLDAWSAGYDTRASRRQTVQAGLRPQLESRWGIEAGYKFERFRQGGSRGGAASLPPYAISAQAEQIRSFLLMNDYTSLHTYEHTANGGASWRIHKALIATASASYDLKEDRNRILPSVETMGGGAGLTFRVPVFKMEANYRLARSRGGADTLQQSVSASLDINPVPQARWANRLEYSTSARPSTANTDFTSSLEMSF